MTQPIAQQELAKLELPDWHVADQSLEASYETGDFVTGLELVNQIGAAAEQANHHPDITLEYSRVGIRLTSHDVGGVTSRDIELAGQISQLAAALGVHRQS